MSELAPRPDPSITWNIYGAPWCSPCQRIKKFLTDNNEQYTYNNLGNDMTQVRNFITSFSDITDGNTKIPMVFHKGVFIKGGCAGTISYYKKMKKENSNEQDEQN